MPRKFLEQILLELKRRGLVHSVRGRHGGYQLGRNPKDISFAEIIRLIDGPLALSPCASRTAYRRCDDCTDEATCAIRKALIDVRNCDREDPGTTLARGRHGRPAEDEAAACRILNVARNFQSRNCALKSRASDKSLLI